MNNRLNRINQIINQLGLTKNSLATLCSIAPSNLSKMLSGEQTITDKTLHKIADAFPQINLQWLKTGEGEMINPNSLAYQRGNGNVLQHGHAGHDLTQTNNSEKFLSEFIEGLKSQNSITIEVAAQAKMALAQNSELIAQMGKSLDEISEQRKLVDRLITIIEKK